MAPTKNKHWKMRGREPVLIDEEKRIELEKKMQEFKNACDNTTDELECSFPVTLSSEERKYIHQVALDMGFSSKSHGAEPARQIIVCKKSGGSEILDAKETLTLTKESLTIIKKCIQIQTLNVVSRIQEPAKVPKNMYRSVMSTKIPPPPKHSALNAERMKLPIHELGTQILTTIRNSNMPVFVKGSTGCGKSTQVPQYLMEEATKNKERINIICAVPRRVAAISICDRVAVERGENVGDVVGYKIRLESETSSRTALTFCTGGILLRSLGDPTYLDNVTHLILDEVHERDKFTDFILGYLKTEIKNRPRLHIILMGATIDFKVFWQFFGSCPVITVEGKLYPVEVYYLQDVLKLTDFHVTDVEAQLFRNKKKQNIAKVKAKREQTVVSHEEMHKLLNDVSTAGSLISATKLVEMVKSGEVLVDYQHPVSKVTILGAVCSRDLGNHVAQLLGLGADIEKESNGVKPKESFKIDHPDAEFPEFGLDDTQEEAEAITSKPNESLQIINSGDHQEQLGQLPSSKDEEMEDPIVTSYMETVNLDRVDVMLICKLIKKLHSPMTDTYAILVFLPGFEDLTTLKHIIINEANLDPKTFKIYLLHSTIAADQRDVFLKVKDGVRKIILSTNIAETSLTIDGVAYVIDSGRVKEKTYDSQTHCSALQSTWISKSSAMQRKGRAGRTIPGICYRLYTEKRLAAMDDFQISEIQRSSLQELCLHCKTFLPNHMGIAEFFKNLPESPSFVAIDDAIKSLKQLNALTCDEQLTELGKVLVEFPVEPPWAKILIYSTILRCVDPILNIISSMCYRAPFVIPLEDEDKLRAYQSKKKLAGNSFSDHIAAMKAVEGWECSQGFQDRNNFCERNSLSYSSLRTISGIKKQLQDILRRTCLKSYTNIDWNYFNSNSRNWSVVKAVLVVGLYSNICTVRKSKAYLSNNIDKKIRFHQTSTVPASSNNFILPSNWVIYNEMTRTLRGSLVQDCTVVSTVTVALFGGGDSFELDTDDLDPFSNEAECQGRASLKIGDWVSLDGNKETLNLLCGLRNRFKSVVHKYLTTGTFDITDEQVVQSLVQVLSLEDMKYESTDKKPPAPTQPAATRPPQFQNHYRGRRGR